MFDKYIHISDNKKVKDAAIIYREATEKVVEKLESISQAEIKSKDRVDIPLSEYLRITEENKKLNRRVSEMSRIIIQLGIPAEVIDRIIPQSICVECCDDYLEYKKHYRVNFAVDDSPDIRRRHL